MRLPEYARRPLPCALLLLSLVAPACGGGGATNHSTDTGRVGGATDAASMTGLFEGVEYLTITSKEHVEDWQEYPTAPPAGGPHLGFWQNCGAYSVAVVDGAAVHSLEHGVVWVTYRPDLGVEAALELRAVLDDRPKTLLSPHAGQTAPVVATAWGRRLELDGVDVPRLTAFLDAFIDAETAPEPGVTCQGALGVPPAAPTARP